MIRTETLIHPGEILLEEFLKPMDISQHKLAMDIHIPATRIHAIVHGKRAITADTALRLAKYFGMEAQFWMNMQNSYDLCLAAKKAQQDLKTIPQLIAS